MLETVSEVRVSLAVLVLADTPEGKKCLPGIGSSVLLRRLVWYERANLLSEPAASIDREQELFFPLVVALYQNTGRHFPEKKIILIFTAKIPIMVAARSKPWVCRHWLAGTVGFNTVGGIGVCFMCCVLLV
jgi:hypothetical protein